ncbi:MAG TPA: hypothetical protein VGO11_15060 [Chthoniobacteraceae bacterium]|nr:hypothetical protein [Chthoniobacteraceae bacterium]
MRQAHVLKAENFQISELADHCVCRLRSSTVERESCEFRKMADF